MDGYKTTNVFMLWNNPPPGKYVLEYICPACEKWNAVEIDSPESGYVGACDYCHTSVTIRVQLVIEWKK